MKSETGGIVLLLALSSCLLFVNGGGYDLWPPDEPRYAEVAREMVLSGDYLVPRINGETYTEKPPLLFWCISIVGLLLGAVNEWAARIPSMLAGIYVICMTYILGARLFDRRVALWSGLILLSAVGFWLQARKGQIDMVLCACLITTFYAFWRWENERLGRWLWLAYTGVALGLLAKGPPALVFPLLYIFSFYWKNPQGRRRTRWLLGSVAATIPVLLWFVPARLAGADTTAQAIESDIGANLFRNTIGRFLLGVSKAQPPWYYLETLPVDFLPWTLVCPPLLYWAWKNRKSSQASRFLFCWIVPAIVFFSISIGKRGLYLVPVFPAIALVLAVALVQRMDSPNLVWVRRGGLIWSGLLVVFLFSPLLLPWFPYTLQNSTHLYVLAACTGLAGAIGFFVLYRNPRRIGVVFAVQTAVLYPVIALTAFPEIDHFKSARPICAPVRQLTEQAVPFDLYSIGFSREEYVYYARTFHEPVLTELIGEFPKEELLEQATLQKSAQRLIRRAVEDIAIADLADVTATERDALLTAITEAVAEHEDGERILAFEQSLIVEISRFFDTFTAKKPAMAFVQEETWRWLVPLYPGKLPVSILVDRPVGSRHVLLIANEGAVRALGMSG